MFMLLDSLRRTPEELGSLNIVNSVLEFSIFSEVQNCTFLLKLRCNTFKFQVQLSWLSLCKFGWHQLKHTMIQPFKRLLGYFNVSFNSYPLNSVLDFQICYWGAQVFEYLLYNLWSQSRNFHLVLLRCNIAVTCHYSEGSLFSDPVQQKGHLVGPGLFWDNEQNSV